MNNEAAPTWAQVLARKLRMVGIDTAVAGQVLRFTYLAALHLPAGGCRCYVLLTAYCSLLTYC